MAGGEAVDVRGPTPGPHRPLPASPARRPGSVRRTTTVDTAWPDLDAGEVAIDVRGRDLRTAADGTAEVLEEVGYRLRADLAAGRVLAIEAAPPELAPRLGAVVGGTLRAGFGRHVATALAAEAASRTLLHATLEDLNGAFLVSGYAMLRGGAFELDAETQKERAVHQADICIGWASGSDMYRTLRFEGRNAVPFGPVAPVLDAGDPEGWHPVAPLAERAMRRRRQLDVWALGGGALGVHSHFRDSYAAADHEMALHEYVVEATVDDHGRLASVVADPRTLPWRECPGAAASAAGIVGTSLEEVAARVRRDLVGATTCTHLSSTLRLLADVPALAAALEGQP